MADLHQVITLGLGTPADLPHFLLVGLSPNPNVHTLPTVARTRLESRLSTYSATGPRYRLEARLPRYTVERS